MNTGNLDRAEALFLTIGEIEDTLVTEAETVETLAPKMDTKRLVTYGAIAAGASGVVAAAFFFLRGRRRGSVAA